MSDLEQLKYPIGKVQYPSPITYKHITQWIAIVEDFPKAVEREIGNLPPLALRYKYRPKGWTIQQVVNHCIDSHLHSFIRFKLALTEENPIIRPYFEGKWAELPDTVEYHINESLILLKALHTRWVFLLKKMIPREYKRTFVHPEGMETISLEENLCIYAWHCEHHLKHIINAKKYKYN